MLLHVYTRDRDVDVASDKKKKEIHFNRDQRNNVVHVDWIRALIEEKIFSSSSC